MWRSPEWGLKGWREVAATNVSFVPNLDILLGTLRRPRTLVAGAVSTLGSGRTFEWLQVLPCCQALCCPISPSLCRFQYMVELSRTPRQRNFPGISACQGQRWCPVLLPEGTKVDKSQIFYEATANSTVIAFYRPHGLLSSQMPLHF